jgi:hypothetical protein
MDREQLEALRRQVEEDYRLDIAAIERLQRRCQGSSSYSPSSAPGHSMPINAYSPAGEWSGLEARKEPASPGLPQNAPAERTEDELVGSLRTMFSTVRK